MSCFLQLSNCPFPLMLIRVLPSSLTTKVTRGLRAAVSSKLLNSSNGDSAEMESDGEFKSRLAVPERFLVIWLVLKVNTMSNFFSSSVLTVMSVARLLRLQNSHCRDE